MAFYQSGSNLGGLDLRSADLLDRILEFTGDDHSRGYYIKLIRELGTQRVEMILSEKGVYAFDSLGDFMFFKDDYGDWKVKSASDCDFNKPIYFNEVGF